MHEDARLAVEVALLRDDPTGIGESLRGGALLHFDVPAGPTPITRSITGLPELAVFPT